ncbi:class I SAM-dependent methyltransferase [Occallatibacter savannae]|uniref:class I SAM-dependent methyltransferase n=1 Tax=Occallatibacter savannae TaxID=1002691 RepID=UPI0013A53B49|nr:class I SAM-dependent methyltransferase [Occallatibacter savannae]
MTIPVELAVAQGPPATATPDFNRLARVYRWMEWLTFGPFLERCRSAYIPTLTRCRRALILGDGDGRFTARLLRSNPAIEIDAVDASPAMLRQLAGRSPSHRIRTCVADARAFTPSRHDYDLIATHFFLDCLTQNEVSDLASRLRRHAAPGATWLISEFAIPSSFFGRVFAAPLVRLLYLAFRLLTNLQIRSLPDHHSALSQSGWTLRSQRKFLGGLLVSEAWAPNRKLTHSSPPA